LKFQVNQFSKKVQS